MFEKIIIIATSTLVLAGCASYKLLPAGTTAVAGDTFHVTSALAWNLVPPDKDDPFLEHWTLNGINLDNLVFVGGIADGKPLMAPKAHRDAPLVSPTMSPQDMAAMLERYYSDTVGVTGFAVIGTDATNFLGRAAQMDFQFTGPDDVVRRGRAVYTVRDARLFMMMLDGINEHYFDAALPEFLAMVASAAPSQID